jgi:hypothetical protein
VVPAAACSQAAACRQQGSLQHTLVQLLLQQALPAAMATAVPAEQQVLGAGSAADEVAAYSEAAAAVLGHGMVQQLLQLLAALQLQTCHAGAAVDPVSTTAAVSSLLPCSVIAVV